VERGIDGNLSEPLDASGVVATLSPATCRIGLWQNATMIRKYPQRCGKILIGGARRTSLKSEDSWVVRENVRPDNGVRAVSPQAGQV